MFYIVSLTTIEISCTNLQDEPNTYGMISLCISSIYILAKVVVFVTLMVMMRMFGYYVYAKIFRTICTYFVLDFLSYGVTIWIFTTSRVIFDTWPAVQMIQQVLYIVNMPVILSSLAVLYFKHEIDMLQELSKLDYLIKVSIF